MIVWNSETALPRNPQPDPESPGEFLYRDDDIDVEPPEYNKVTEECKWIDSEWVISTKKRYERVNGVDVEIDDEDRGQSTKQPLSAEEQLRGERQQKFQEMEQYGKGLQDRPFTQKELDYRQALRDLPAKSTPELDENGYLIGVDWPTHPQE
tara:strand:- start:64 stop:519 length:456 start_codon:yes stop_codon:yes gene_type:complete